MRELVRFKFILFIVMLSVVSAAVRLPVNAQNYVKVINFTKADYQGGNQNWDISLNDAGQVFVANNAGLLSIDGAGISLHQLASKTIIRSVACIGDKVFTGSFEEFGYWKSNGGQTLEYHSLVTATVASQLKNDEIWKIVAHNDAVYFQSFGSIFCYRNDSITRLKVPGPVLFLLEASQRLFIQQINGALFEIIGDTLVHLEGSDIFSDTEIKAILPYGADKFLIGTSSKGLYIYSNGRFEAWNNTLNDVFKTMKINHGERIANAFAFGTLLNGVYLIDYNGALVQHIHTSNGLQNNTILALKADKDGNLWIGMDKGFGYLWFDSPVEIYRDNAMSHGTVYTASLFGNELYIGTNQGIFYYQFTEKGGFTDKKLLPESQGQVWFIQEIDGQLYCGLNNGTFIIDNHMLRKVCDVSGGYNLKKIAANNGEHMIQSTYSALAVFRKDKQVWVKDHEMDGFMAPTRFLESDFLGNLLLGHSISGLYLAQPSPDFDSMLKVIKLGPEQGLDFATNKVYKVDNRLIVPSGKQLFQWDAINNTFVEYQELEQQLEGFASATSIIQVAPDKYWFVKDNELGMFEIRFGTAKLLYRLIPEMYDLNLVENYENITALNDSLQLICLDEGFAILNLYRLHRIPEVNKAPSITSAYVWNNPEKHQAVTSDIKSFSFLNNNFNVSFSTEEPEGRKKYFQFMLKGIDQNWSDWSSKTETSYNRLPPGNYSFLVRALTVKGMATKASQVDFRIRMPWYLSVYAIMIEFILLVSLLILLNINYKRRRWRLREKLLKQENERIKQLKEQAEGEIIKLSNEKLQSEIAQKNLELAKNTMAILRKNELLINIKTELDNQKEELGYRLPARFYDSLSKLIDHGITSEHEWEMFDHLFDQAHENFFRRLKVEFPDLTASELRLCAYLKLNLASKEIAPLMNITIRGVEEKRYRLRKKLNLPSEQSLNDFIVGF